MTDSDKLTKAQDYISRELQKQGSDRIDALHWEQSLHDQATKIHRLDSFRGGEKSIFTFTEYKLLDDYGSREWEKQMRRQVGDILMEL
jgi:hypothetical protein